ncbi:MAG TPA: tetratricopeptide repeat protein [Myxococcota bacterium]|jgi:tetratricopeptide (TPR) repeat protein|nr:tetratricopeptide repeat protein [Myxococcota bacterium]
MTTRRRRFWLGVAMLIAGFSPALAGFDPLRSENDDVTEGNALLADGKVDEALEAYGRAAAVHPTEPILSLDRGLAFYKKKDFARARDEFLRATAAASSAVRADAFYGLGNAYFQTEDWEKAIEAYKRSLLIDHTAADAKWNLELALRRLEEKKKKDEEEKKKTPPESSPESKPESSPESKPESKPAPESSPSGPPESKPAAPDTGAPDTASPEGGTGAASSAPKPDEPAGLDPSAVLDALKDHEKAVKKEDRMKALGIKPRAVEKDW